MLQFLVNALRTIENICFVFLKNQTFAEKLGLDLKNVANKLKKWRVVCGGPHDFCAGTGTGTKKLPGHR